MSLSSHGNVSLVFNLKQKKNKKKRFKNQKSTNAFVDIEFEE